jgi:hypothetical protein
MLFMGGRQDLVKEFTAFQGLVKYHKAVDEGGISGLQMRRMGQGRAGVGRIQSSCAWQWHGEDGQCR